MHSQGKLLVDHATHLKPQAQVEKDASHYALQQFSMHVCLITVFKQKNGVGRSCHGLNPEKNILLSKIKKTKKLQSSKIYL